jgi:hypothetical protein
MGRKEHKPCQLQVENIIRLRLSDVQASQSFALKAPFGFPNSIATVASKKVYIPS